MTQSIPVIVDMPKQTLVKADLTGSMEGRRPVYFEATRDGVVDRQGEMVAADCLWASRELMLDQGDFDMAHWAHLNNPLTGRPQLEYRIGLPNQITRSRDQKSIYCGGDIFSSVLPPPDQDCNSMWADRFYHSLVGIVPPAKWFPSVYGRIPPNGIEIIKVNGQQVRRIVQAQWISVGFATRAQHPTLGAVSTTPVGTLMAKADQGAYLENAEKQGVLHLSWGTFAKAMSDVGMPVTDTALMTGVQALTPASVDGQLRRTTPGTELSHKKVRLNILKAIQRGDLPATLKAITAAYVKAGAGASEARELARQLLRDIEVEASN